MLGRGKSGLELLLGFSNSLGGQLGRLQKPLAVATLLDAVQRSRGDVNVIHYNAAWFWRFQCVLNELLFNKIQTNIGG